MVSKQTVGAIMLSKFNVKLIQEDKIIQMLSKLEVNEVNVTKVVLSNPIEEVSILLV